MCCSSYWRLMHKISLEKFFYSIVHHPEVRPENWIKLHARESLETLNIIKSENTRTKNYIKCNNLGMK